MLLFDQAGSAPTAPAAQPYTWHRRVKLLQAATPAALETLINNFLITLENDAQYKFGAAIIGQTLMSPESDVYTAITAYGYFTTP